MQQWDTLITVKRSAPAAKSTGSLSPLRTPRGHSMSPKMFLMQPFRYSCRSSIMPSEFLHARITPSWGWFSSHSEISVRMFWAGVEEKGLVVRDRGAWVGTSPSTAPLQTGWGVLTHTDRKPGACSQGTQPLLSGSGEPRLCSGVCVCVCVYEHAPGGTGAHTCVHMFRACVCTDISVCVCVCVSVRAQQQRAVLIILCDVCTPGSVGGQQGTFTVRPRPEPPRVIRFCGGGTGGRGQSETLSDLSSSRENGLDTPQLDRHRKGCVRNLV